MQRPILERGGGNEWREEKRRQEERGYELREMASGDVGREKRQWRESERDATRWETERRFMARGRASSGETEKRRQVSRWLK